MALTNKKYEKFYKTDGSGNDKITSEKLTFAEDVWDLDRANGMKDHINNPDFAPLIFQLQQIQDELDYLRTEILRNYAKSNTKKIRINTIKVIWQNTLTYHQLHTQRCEKKIYTVVV